MGKRALVTGAGRGIGRAIAEVLSADGFDLTLISRTESELQATKAQILSRHPRCDVEIATVDLGAQKSIDGFLSSRDLSSFDVLVNNAGVYRRGTLELSVAELRELIEVNLMGVFRMCQAVVPHMKARGTGYVFNIGSVCSITGFAGVGGYCASKFGLLGLNESLYNELVPYGVRVSAICPSWVATKMAAQSPVPDEDKIQPSDIAAAVRFCLSLSHGAAIKELIVPCGADVPNS